MFDSNYNFDLLFNNEFVYMLAPMEKYTDTAFRTLCFIYGADLTFTEMARIDGLVRKNKSTVSKITNLNEVSTQIQIFGANLNKLGKFLLYFKPEPGFKGFNINIGCPSPELVNKGLGAAMIKRIKRVSEMVDMIKDMGFPCSIKMRLGLNEFEKQNKVYLNLIKEVNADFFIVHPRTAKDSKDDPLDLEVYKECVATGKKIIANGGINSISDVELVKSFGVAGVMIGRRAIERPDIFRILKGAEPLETSKIRADFGIIAKKFSVPFSKRQKIFNCIKEFKFLSNYDNLNSCNDFNEVKNENC